MPRDLLRYRYLFEQMVRRELRQKYKGSALGVLWYLVNPLVLMGAYTIMFTYVLKNGFHLRDYALFVLVGIVVWTFFQQALLGAATSLLDQGALVRKALFPRQTIPATVVTVQLATFCTILLLILPIVLVVHGSLTGWLVLLPAYVVLLFLFTLGLGLGAAVLHAHFRDVAPILGAALLPWFFITPIFYPSTGFPGAARHHVLAAVLRWGNPVAPFVEAIRAVTYGGVWPGWDVSAYVLVASGLALAGGTLLFRRLEGELAVVV
ncbi:MAG: lipopolysaccharide transport system permease protein [Solirubrobacteraceae bacterium]|jgi:ABC-type polysaccharide/polyol phosphate export permease|nr:lipopolysaccharide transport system permease protein [Solirubrobacteraceae bacterium]MEA2356670.1 lipopolysaccharide transport system permease protein [Solirubrobacteraceae bacterium]